jgi:hypothetical protein
VAISPEHRDEGSVPHHVLRVRVHVNHFYDVAVLYQFVIYRSGLMQTRGDIEGAGRLNASPKIKTESVIGTRFGHYFESTGLKQSFNPVCSGMNHETTVD